MPFEPVFKSSGVGGFQPVLRPKINVMPIMKAHQPTANINPFQDNFTPNANTVSMQEIAGQVAPQPDQPLLERIARGAANVPVGMAAMAEQATSDPVALAKGIGQYGKTWLQRLNPNFLSSDAILARQEWGQQAVTDPVGSTLDAAGVVGTALGLPAIGSKVKGFLSSSPNPKFVPEILRAAIQKEVSPVAEQRVMGVSRETPTVEQPTTATEVVAKAKPNAITKDVKTFTPDELTAAQARLREKFKPMDEATKPQTPQGITEDLSQGKPFGTAGSTQSYRYDYNGKPISSYKKPIEAMTQSEFIKAVFDGEIYHSPELKFRTGKIGTNRGRGINTELLAKVHRKIVADAPVGSVPSSVLSDYPDLAAKYGKPTTAEAVVKKAGEQGGGSVELGALGTPSAIKDFIQGESALNKAWESVVDKGKAKIGQYIPDVIKRALAPSHDRSQVWMEAKDQTRFAKMQGIEETTNIAREAKSAIPRTDLEKAYDYLDPTERGVERPTLPESQAKPLDAMRERLKSMGQEAVDVGVLKPEDYAAGIDTYLKRTYLKYEVPTARKLFRQFRIKGTKGRVLKTAEERTEAGIIRDPVYNFAKGAAELRHDIETAKLFKKVAESPEFSDQVGTDWKEGFANRSVPKRPEFGALQGKYVSQGIYDDLMEMQKYWDKGTAGRIYDKLLGSWKYSKTILNPSTWARNGWSSTIQADVIGGLSPVRLDVYAKAAKEMAAHTGDFAELVQAGKMRRSTYTADISEFASFLDRGGNVTMLERMADYMMSGKKISNFAQRLGGAYGGMEDFFKLAVYKYQKGLGKSSQAALKIAEQAIPDYRVSTPFVNKVARYAIPFIKYPYKILPAIAESAIKHPIRFGKYPVMIYMMNQYAKDQLGLSEEEYKKLQDTKKFSGSSSMLMPFNDKQGNPLVLDLTYNLPWGDALEHGAGFAGAAGLTESNNWGGRILSMFNPLAKIPAEMAFNKSTYSGREIYNPRVDTGAEAFVKLMKHGYQQMSPPLAPGNYAWNEVSRTITGKPNYLGEKPSGAATLFKQLGGLKTSPVNVEHETKMEKIDITKNMDAIEKVMWNVKNDKSLDEEERQKRMALLKKKWYAELAKLHSQ